MKSRYILTFAVFLSLLSFSACTTAAIHKTDDIVKIAQGYSPECPPPSDVPCG